MTDPAATTRLLLIEDDAASARLLRLELDDAAPGRFETVVAADLADALAEVERAPRPFGAALLDLGLPDATGLDGLAALQRADARLPVVVLTGREDPELADAAVRAGAQDYLVKGSDGAPTVERALRYAVERKRAALELERRSRDQARLGAFGEALLAAQELDDVSGAVADHLPALLRGPVRLVVDSSLPAMDEPPVARPVPTAFGPDEGDVEVRPGVRLVLDASGAAAPEARDDAVLATVVRLLTMQIAALDLRASLQRSSVRDPLTELFNRRYLFETAERELRRAERNGGPVGAIFLDVDHFKRVNDRLGHAVGDHALRAVAAILAASFRREDVVARYGGEEFVALLPGASLADTVQRAEGVRRRIAAEAADLVRSRAADGPAAAGESAPTDALRLTASVGVAAFPDHGGTVGEIFEAADGACYRAKATGRDRVTVAP